MLRNSNRASLPPPLCALLTPSQLPPGKYYRFTNQDETHHGVTYGTGLNVDPLPFTPRGECVPGGMYFFHESQVKYLLRTCRGVVWMREVTFPGDANVNIWSEFRKFKTDKFILSEREPIPEWVWLATIPVTPMLCLLSIPKDKLTDEMCLEAVKQCGTALEYVPKDKLTDVVCLEAVKQCGCALQYVPKDMRSQAICLEAVKQCGTALEYVPEDMRTPEMLSKATWY